jgi:hypothetical protein
MIARKKLIEVALPLGGDQRGKRTREGDPTRDIHRPQYLGELEGLSGLSPDAESQAGCGTLNARHLSGRLCRMVSR